jgi:predicted nucleic acid-binding protein
MSKYHCVLDSSALIKKYHSEAGSHLITPIFNREDCALHVLNISIPETTGVFVRWQLEGGISEKEREKLLEYFIKDIREYRVIIHNITHRNIVFTDDVWNHSIKTRLKQGSKISIPQHCPNCNTDYQQEKVISKKRIGPNDALILSVCSELYRVYKQAYLFTSDEHMFDVATKMGLRPFNPENSSKLPF